MNKLHGKVIVITGGAGLLGRAFAHGVADSGGIAVAADVDLSAARKLVQERRSSLGQIEAAEMDITDRNSICAVIDDLIKRYGRIDAVVNNAYPRNKHYGRKLEDVSYEDFCENIDLHLGGYFLVAQQFCQLFKAQGIGNVVNMASIYGAMTPRFNLYDGTSMTMPIEYAAIKSAVIQLTRYFSQYFKGTGIRVNCLSPGGILADQPPEFLAAYNRHCASKGMLEPGDIVGALLFLLSDDSKFLSGHNLLVDDGFSL